MCDMESINTFIEQYISRGFGSMTKNDFEVFIFNRLLSMPEYQGKDNYSLSILLRIPESKIKRLRYESALKYGDGKVNYKEKVKALLTCAQLRGGDRKIVFQVEDVLLKSYISSVLKKDGRSIDTSFNPELVVIRLEDYYYFLSEVYSSDEVNSLMSKAKQAAQREVTWKDITQWVVEGAAGGVADGLVSSATINLSPLGIINTICRLFSQKKISAERQNLSI